ncbi:cobalamin biosynthesis protein CbiX [Aneurinibacillus sp. BA2021]|nr:cobalamin biosynthesis protein CbiX [Aneurinibacillus sp. BA2021]
MKRGVLVISHGSRSKKWVSAVDTLLAQVRANVPIEAGFLDMVEGRTVEAGLRRLEAAGVGEILAVPLFVSDGSTHVSEIRYALGLDRIAAVQTELKPIAVQARIVWSDPMNDHPLVYEIMRDRVRALSTQPAEETLLLVAHGSEAAGFAERWQHMLARLGATLQDELGLRSAAYGTIHPDTVAYRARAAAEQGRLLVVPVFLSPGYYTEKAIPERLAEIPHRYDGSAYLPDPRVAHWIEASIAGWLAAVHSHIQ